MKRLLALALAALMLLSLAACGKKAETEKPEPEEIAEPAEIKEDNVDAPSENPAEWSSEYWEEQYPEDNICPFAIEVDGVEYPYYYVSSLCDGTMESWINTPMNWDGWHLVGTDIVNKDETFRITDDWVGENRSESFSSCCTVTTEPFNTDGTVVIDIPTTGYNFKGYTETADWPEEEMWLSYGLPKLVLTDDVNGSVHISDKDWIYPLNGKDGILIEVRPETSQIDSLVEYLISTGIPMEEDSAFDKGYTAYYDNYGTLMKFTISETETGKLSLLIITDPTD